MRNSMAVKASGLEGASALDLLRKENELLKRTITDASVSIEDLEQQLLDAGVDLPTPPAMLEAQVRCRRCAGLHQVHPVFA